MANGRWSSAIGQVARLWSDGTSVGQPESQLLGRYLDGDEAAFEALVARHGPMVQAVCRKVLNNPADADDAFQAAFLVLARKARSVRAGAPLENWLYGVARKVAARARVEAETRRRRELGRGESSEGGPDPFHEAQQRELAEVVQYEVDRLSSAGRAVIVLCDLAGCSHEEAASRLGLPLGTVKSRHFRARDQLRKRLARRGLAPSDALAAVVARPEVRDVSHALIEATSRSAFAYATGRATLAGMVPTHAASLAHGVLTTMLNHQLKLAAAATLGAFLLAAGTGVVARGVGGNTGLAGPEQVAAPGAPAEARPSDVQVIENPADAAKIARAEARIAIARRAIADLELYLKNGNISSNDPAFSLWWRRIAETRREAGGKHADLIADLDAYLKVCQKSWENAKKLKIQGEMSQVDVLDAEYRVVEAEDWLAQAKGRR